MSTRENIRLIARAPLLQKHINVKRIQYSVLVLSQIFNIIRIICENFNTVPCV